MASAAFRKSWHAAPATWALAGLLLAAWLLAALALPDALIDHAVFFPDDLAGAPRVLHLIPSWLTPFTALFVHIGFFHLALNLLALVGFGRAVEPAVGAPGVGLLLLTGAVASAGAYFLLHPTLFPWVGAGGVVSALIGAYASLFGRSRVRSKTRIARWAYALWLCVGWILLALLVSFVFAGPLAIYYGPAYLAAFAAGFLVGPLLLLFRYRKA